MKTKGICVSCNENEAKNILEKAFEEKGFKVDHKGGSYVAEKGNRTMRLLFGGLAKYEKMEFDLTPRSDQTVVTLKKASSGISGGLLGASEAEKGFNKMVNHVVDKFKSSGVKFTYE